MDQNKVIESHIPDLQKKPAPSNPSGMDHSQKLRLDQVIVVNDLSGFGRCSIAVQLPVLSVMKAECLLMPTALLSNHTAYPSFYVRDLSEDLDPWMNEWTRLPIHPSAILTGYLGNASQVQELFKLADLFHHDQCLLIVDPVMGDDGCKYSSITENHLEAMKKLAQKADLITPNTTEACLLCHRPWKETWQKNDLEELIGAMQNQGYPERMIITGIRLEDGRLGDAIVEGKQVTYRFFVQIYPSRPGTGDLFSAVVCGSLLQGDTLVQAVARAQDFIQAALEATQRYNVPQEEGCAFEAVLGQLLDGSQKPGP